MEPSDAPVCVVGGGPVGLTVTYLLARRGIPVDVFESAGGPSTEWRASTFHPPTLELFASVGLADEMIAAGLIARDYQIRDLELDERAVFDLGVLAEDTPFPFRLQYEQYKLVALLLGRLADDANVEVTYATEVMGVTDGRHRATVELAGPSGRQRRDYGLVIGTDGARSQVRRSLGIDFDGMTYEHSYVLVSIDTDLADRISGLSYVNYIGGSSQHLMLLRIPDLWRVLLSMDGGDETGGLSSEHIVGRLAPLFDDPEPRTLPIVQRQAYRIHQRVAGSFVGTRAVLAGDAAHVNSPFGGLGLNSGLHDAFDLVARIGDGLLADRSADLRSGLAAYGHRRRTVAIDYVGSTSDANTRLLSDADKERRRTQLNRLRAIADDPNEARQYLRNATMLRAVWDQGIG